MKYFVSILLLAMFFGILVAPSVQAAQKISWSQLKVIYSDGDEKGDG